MHDVLAEPVTSRSSFTTTIKLRWNSSLSYCIRYSRNNWRRAQAYRSIQERRTEQVAGPIRASSPQRLLEAAQQWIRAAGHPSRITSEAASETMNCLMAAASSAARFSSENRLALKGKVALICDDCMYEVASNLPDVVEQQAIRLCLRRPATGISPAFPGSGWSRPRGNFRVTCAPMFKPRSTSCSLLALRFFGVHEEFRHETMTFARCMRAVPLRADDRAGAISRGRCRRDRAGEVPAEWLWLCRTRATCATRVLLSVERDE